MGGTYVLFRTLTCLYQRYCHTPPHADGAHWRPKDCKALPLSALVTVTAAPLLASSWLQVNDILACVSYEATWLLFYHSKQHGCSSISGAKLINNRRTPIDEGNGYKGHKVEFFLMRVLGPKTP